MDTLILDWMYEKDVVMKPKLFQVNMDRELPDEETPSLAQVRRRFIYLRDEAGLLEQYGEARGHYCLSELGVRYMEDDLNDSELYELATIDPQQGGDS